MTKYFMGAKEVIYLRDARKGDFGWNAQKPRQAFIEIPGEGRKTVPFANLKIVKDEPVATPRRGRKKEAA